MSEEGMGTEPESTWREAVPAMAVVIVGVVVGGLLAFLPGCADDVRTSAEEAERACGRGRVYVVDPDGFRCKINLEEIGP